MLAVTLASTLGLPAPLGSQPNSTLPLVEETTPNRLETVSMTYNIHRASNGYFDETDGAITGYKPSTGGPFPLFIWSPGTGSTGAETLDQSLVRMMAQRGFFAVAVEYGDYNDARGGDNVTLKAQAIAGGNQYTALTLLCATAHVDCTKGIASAGYSQGTTIATLVSKFAFKITAAYMIEGARPLPDKSSGVGDPTICDNDHLAQYLPQTKRRYMTGEGDEYFAWVVGSGSSYPSRAGAEQNLKYASGYDCGTTPKCLQSDGSGYVVTVEADTDGAGTPDHFNWASKTAVASWFNDAPVWGLQASFDWLAHAAQN